MKTSIRFFKKRIFYGFLGKTYHSSQRSDNKFRWEKIEQHLDSSDKNALDLGCADGFFSNELSKKGVLTLGIDYNRLRLKQCRKKYSEKEELSFMRCDLNERSISKIPETDVVLVLTVFHHWADIHGFEEAEKMLKEIGKKTEKIFFELPVNIEGSRRIESTKIPDRKEDLETHKAFLDSMLDDIEIELVCRTEYSEKKEREDFVFKIDTSNIQ